MTTPLSSATPSLTSTLAFLAIVAFNCAALVLGVRHAYREHPARRQVVRATAALLALCLVTTALFAATGVFAALANASLLVLYALAANGIALGVALSPVGRRLSRELPLAALIGFQSFRLPLELVLHAWYVQGVVPVQMTYSGQNFDIVTGIVSLVVAALLRLAPLKESVGRRLAWGSTLLGLALLLRVMNIALRSTPGMARTFLDEPPLLLAFQAPYTWILPICVGGALMGHVLTLRRLTSGRAVVRLDQRVNRRA